MSRLLMIVAALCTATPRYPAYEPSLKDVLSRMGAYVDAYGERAAILVATEHYRQDVTSSSVVGTGHRVLVSDFAIVKVEGIRGWMGFRDVVEVDGRKVEDRAARLVESLMSPAASYDEARRISDESARFNIGSVLRNFNVPTTALFFFKTDRLDRFKFSRKRGGTGRAWEIEFRETARPTMIVTPEGRGVPTAGSIWVDPDDGTVLRTRIRMSDFSPPGAGSARGSAEVDVTYGRVAALNMWLPATMAESYDGTRFASWDRITGHAEYSDYRQFQTLVRIK